MMGNLGHSNATVSLLEQVIESMNEMVCVINIDGDVVYSNAKMEKVIGTKQHRKCPGKMGRNDCPVCYADVCVAQGRPQNMIYELNGRVYNVALSPLRDTDNDILNILEVWTDITGEKRLKERLTAQNNLLKSDLELASTLQRSMLPDHMTQQKSVRFDMMYFPCEDVGGDFYDVFTLDENKTVFYIADVSGHGVSAAMLTVFFSQTVRSVMDAKKTDIEPADVLREVWQRFMEMDIQEHLYITAWLGVLDASSGLLKYANAGHMIAPLLYDGYKTEPLTAHGYPICRWISSTQFQQQEREIDKGTRILLYTDGLSDAWRTLKPDRQNDMYKTPDALAAACLKMTNFKEILQSIWAQVSPDDNTRDLSDDIAMLLVEKTT